MAETVQVAYDNDGEFTALRIISASALPDFEERGFVAVTVDPTGTVKKARRKRKSGSGKSGDSEESE